MFVPFYAAADYASPDLHMRVKNLETALTLSFGLLKSLAQRLEDKLGPNFIGPELSLLTQSESGLRQQVLRLGEIVASGELGVAARVCRDLTGMTWDEAYYLMEHWGDHPFEKKLRWIEFAHWMRTLNTAAGAATNENS